MNINPQDNDQEKKNCRTIGTTIASMNTKIPSDRSLPIRQSSLQRLLRLVRSEEFTVSSSTSTSDEKKKTTTNDNDHDQKKKKETGEDNNKSPSLSVGRRLGQGEFCDVYEVTVQQRQPRTLALKRLRRDIPFAQQDLDDLQWEAQLLSDLKHKHIVRVHSMSYNCSNDSNNNKTKEQPQDNQDVVDNDKEEDHHCNNFYYVMDRLACTLDQKMNAWKRKQQLTLSSSSSSSLSGSGSKRLLIRLNSFYNRQQQQKEKSFFLLERMEAGLQLARAVRYLHRQNVVHRDLKPTNIGFDHDGRVKVFDFGLATRRKRSSSYLHGAIGTCCYMAPEMLLRQTYDQSVDVYTYGLVLWEMCSLEPVYGGYTERQCVQRVAKRGERPKIAHWWPRPLQKLLRQCWAHDATERPTMEQVVPMLEDLLNSKKESLDFTTHNDDDDDDEEEEEDNDSLCMSNDDNDTPQPKQEQEQEENDQEEKKQD